MKLIIYQASNNKYMRSLEPSDTSSLADIMTSFMNGKIKPRNLKDTKESLSISQRSGKLPIKKMQKMTHKN